MDLVFYYIFIIIIFIFVLWIVSFPGITCCDRWFDQICKPFIGDNWFFGAWVVAMILLIIGGWMGDRVLEGQKQDMYRFFYGFLLASIFVWAMGLLGARNAAVGTLAALFVFVMAFALIFLTTSTGAKIIYAFLTLWGLFLLIYTFSLLRMNVGNKSFANVLY